MYNVTIFLQWLRIFSSCSWPGYNILVLCKFTKAKRRAGLPYSMYNAEYIEILICKSHQTVFRIESVLHIYTFTHISIIDVCYSSNSTAFCCPSDFCGNLGKLSFHTIARAVQIYKIMWEFLTD